MYGAMSDAHCGDRGRADRCNYYALDWAVEAFCSLSVTDVFTLGDMLDFVKFGARNVVLAQRLRWERYARQFNGAGIRLHYGLGNHDWTSTEIMVRVLLAWGFRNPHVFVRWQQGPWVLEHGNRFDPRNVTPPGPAQQVLRGITRGAGFVESRLPFRFNESVLTSPVRWLSPTTSLPLRMKVHQRAEAWAMENHEHLLFGHSHERYQAVLFDGMGIESHVINAGTLDIDGPATPSIVLFNDQGGGEHFFLGQPCRPNSAV